MEQKMDTLGFLADKSIVKELRNGQNILLSCSVFKFNDYKKKQERNLLITTLAVYNLKANTIRRRIDVEKVSAISLSRIGTEFVLHVPSEYDYRYACGELRDKIIYFLLKAFTIRTETKMPVYWHEELSLVDYAFTKEERKKEANKAIKGEPILHTDESFLKVLQAEESERDIVRKKTKTLFARDQKLQVTLDDFTPKIVIGKGAFGTVILVEKKDSKELFAMKSITKEDIVRKNQVEHTKTEKMVLEHINHPFLVNLAYAFQTPTRLIFIMQFMRGGELFQHLTHAKKFPEKQARFYALQIATALGHLHSKNFIYRDLKLQNVLMDDEGNVCLTDFGMAKVMAEGQVARTFCGTPEYLAPEVLAGQGYNHMADWWSLGILTFEMMFGLPPFFNKSQQTMFKLIKEAELRFPEEKGTISIEAKDFLIRILHKDPNSRLGAKRDFEQIATHPWFKSIDMAQLLRKELATPFKPKIEGNAWMEGFDKEFLSSKVAYEESNSSEPEKYKSLFAGF